MQQPDLNSPLYVNLFGMEDPVRHREKGIAIVPVSALDPDSPYLQPNEPGRMRCKTAARWLIEDPFCRRVLVLGGPVLDTLSPATVYWEYTCYELLGEYPDLWDKVVVCDGPGITSGDLFYASKGKSHDNSWGIFGRLESDIFVKTRNEQPWYVYFISSYRHWRRAKRLYANLFYRENLRHLPSGEPEPKYHTLEERATSFGKWWFLWVDPFCHRPFGRWFRAQTIRSRRSKLRKFLGKPSIPAPIHDPPA